MHGLGLKSQCFCLQLLYFTVMQALVHVVDYLMVPNDPGMRALLPRAELKASVSG
jgi:hypothetical protein